MKPPLLLAFTLMLLCFPGTAAAQAKASEVVALTCGPVRGLAKDGLHQFLGIPYAAAPVGDLRWRPPLPVAPWTKLREATRFGPACPQTGPLEVASNEDCLCLNVWTQSTDPKAKLPVMVWIHGGGFTFGASSQAEYDGGPLARQGVVVVSVNYRLGPLGFFAHPKLTGQCGGEPMTNFGLLDQIAALNWVRANIAAFGGDPEQVTIFGQSAGSRSVSLLTLSPLAQGRFHRAIAQSGGPIIGSEYLTPAFNGEMAKALGSGRQLSARLGCDQTDDELACLRAKPALEVVKAADVKTSIFEEGLFFAPLFDGQVLPKDPVSAYQNGHINLVPMIVGSTANEGTAYLRGETGLTLARYESFLKARFGERADEAKALFPAASNAQVPAAIDSLLTVATNAQPARFVAREMERNGSKAFLYQFIRRPNTARARELGAFHGVELAYVFGNTSEADGYTDTDRQLSKQIMAYWVQFAKTGDPNGAGLVPWPAYTAASDLNLEFANTVGTSQHLYAKECDFIDHASRFNLVRE